MSTKHEHQAIIAATLAYSAEVHKGSAEARLWRIDILQFMGDLDGLVASGRIDRDTHNVVLWKLKGASS